MLQMLGEELFQKITVFATNLSQDRIAKITGMLLEMDNTELLHLLEVKSYNSIYACH